MITQDREDAPLLLRGRSVVLHGRSYPNYVDVTDVFYVALTFVTMSKHDISPSV